jgi:DNA-binding winged helix-turn-helix (wHTH) protein/WD40 repeat protein
MDVNREGCFTLGDVQVSPSHNTLSARGQTLKLQPKAMAVLHYLACNHGRVISNEELIKQLWEGRIVTHGSVQKSINALRSALAELIGDQEMIAHYSKRGYQLKAEPSFVSAARSESQITESEPHITAVAAIDANSPADGSVPWRWPRRVLWLGGTGLLAIVGLLAFSGLPIGIAPIHKNHKTVFHSAVGYTNETGHERNAVPHPDNEHVAYIREKFNANRQGETESEILVRNKAGKDWRVANSHGSWFKLAWSPAGQHLVALEVKRSEGLPLSPNFYEKPNYLYSFHIFSLDLANDRLLEKQLLSQWQGRISSVTWWDENTLEFVAKQGPNSRNARYRYSTQDQRLSLLEELDGAPNPIASAVLNKKTAVASSHKNMVQIDFLDENQARISRWQLDVTMADISWIPDGSGILVYAEEERKLFTLYLDGQQKQIPLTDIKDRVFSRPRYRPDGDAIFYTEEKRSSNILLLTLAGNKTRLTENTDFNYAASFSPNGEKVVYASVRNNQIHLWLVDDGHERQLTTQPIAKKVGAIIWSDTGEHLVFSVGSTLYHYNFLTAETSLLVSDADKIEPVAYFPDSNHILALKSNGEVRNLWRINTQNHQQKQLTFGAVGSASEYEGDVFFQYVGESGLWVLRHKDDSLEAVAPKLDDNSKLLKIDAKGVYFIRGGLCRESDLFYFDYAQAKASTLLTRDTNIVSTTSFNPKKGLLQTDCYLAEANIVLLK